ncbi:MAG TPA: metallophosphoesterase [Bacteroidales bacterium]|nr:metallophosphoesterase [Bacteroidales bacterium]
MKKRWVIPDVHGCVSTLKTLIGEQIRPARYDQLYFLGDYIDRGPDPKGVIDYIRELQKDEYSITLLRGNHEDFLLELYDAGIRTSRSWLPGLRNRRMASWLAIGGRETLRSFRVKNLGEIPAEYFDWMRSLEYFKELDDFILVHAGLNFNADHPFEDKHSMLWVRDFKVDPEKTGNRRIIHGHVPVHLEMIDLSVKQKYYPFIDLDNGPYIRGKDGFGNLVALELGEMRMVIQDNRDW